MAPCSTGSSGGCWVQRRRLHKLLLPTETSLMSLQPAGPPTCSACVTSGRDDGGCCDGLDGAHGVASGGMATLAGVELDADQEADVDAGLVVVDGEGGVGCDVADQQSGGARRGSPDAEC